MKSILDSSKNPCFFIQHHLKDKSVKEEVEKLCPFSVCGKHIVVKKVRFSKDRLCFVLDEQLEDRKLVSFLLFVMNRWNKGTFALKTENFYEVISVQEGKTPECMLMEALPEKVTKVFDEKTVISQSKSRDIVQVFSLKKRKAMILKLCFLTLLFAFLTFVSLLKNGKVQKAKIIESINAEKLEKRKETDRKAKVKEGLELEKNYEVLLKEKTPVVWNFLEHIFMCIKNSRVKSLHIEGNHFSIEFTGTETVKVLSLFENDGFFKEVKIDRMAAEGKTDSVTLTGMAVQKNSPDEKFLICESDDVSLLEEKIAFYKEEVSKINEMKLKSGERKISVFIESVRNEIKKAGCAEKYIQESEKKGSVFIELMIEGESPAVLRIIKNFCKSEPELLKFLRLSYGKESLLQAVLGMNTGIDAGNSQIKALVEQKPLDISPSQLGKMFLPQKTQTKKIVPVFSCVKNDQTSTRKLSYIGAGRISDSQFVFFQDLKSGEVFELALVTDSKKEIDTDFLQTGFAFNKTEGLFEVHLNGEKYEVKK